MVHREAEAALNGLLCLCLSPPRRNSLLPFYCESLSSTYSVPLRALVEDQAQFAEEKSETLERQCSVTNPVTLGRWQNPDGFFHPMCRVCPSCLLAFYVAPCGRVGCPGQELPAHPCVLNRTQHKTHSRGEDREAWPPEGAHRPRAGCCPWYQKKHGARQGWVAVAVRTIYSGFDSPQRV